MTSFDEREKGFERKFAHDGELTFKTIARRNKLLGLWAAELLEKTGEAATEYAKEVVLADFDIEGDGDVIAKLLKDFYNAQVEVGEKEIIAEMERLLPIARSEIVGK
jgi:hypothetical protein